MTFWSDEPVEFSVLMPRGVDPDELADSLRQANIEVISYNPKTSDYMDCRASKKIFTSFFGVKLKWRTMKIGSWELANDSSYIPDHIDVKAVLLSKNILFPREFIKNWQLKKQKKQDEPKK